MKYLAASIFLAVAIPSVARDVPALLAKLQPTDADPNASGCAIWDRSGPIHHKTTVLDVKVNCVSYTEDPLYVFIEGQFIDVLPLTDGSGHLHLDTDDGDPVPWVSLGDQIYIYANDWTPLLFGFFGGK